MKKLLSLPPNLVGSFHEITGYDKREWFCTNDPVGHKLGSGGGTTWLLRQCYEAWQEGESMSEWLAKDKRIILHAGGQSRRLPSYAPVGKILTPIPVFRWERGQKLSQNLLQLQLPLFERIMRKAPDRLTTMIVSGDVYIRATQPIQEVPDADVVCYGLWLDTSIAKDHGVFVSKRETPSVLDRMIQKPSVKLMGELLQDNLILTDIGIWLLSNRAVELLMKRSMKNGEVVEYDLYSQFGCTLGKNPSIDDEELKQLSVAVIPLNGGEFYHFGTSHELISSMVSIQNLENDQRNIIHRKVKPQPSIFIQNSVCQVKTSEENSEIWIENSWICQQWKLANKNIITGVPQNEWAFTLKDEDCVDVIPIGNDQYCARVYGFNDRFDGDAQKEKRFPVTNDLNLLGQLIEAMLSAPDRHAPQALTNGLEMLSAEEISTFANLIRLEAQRRHYRKDNWQELATNWQNSIFYQLDLCDAAQEFEKEHIPLPPPIEETAPLMTRIHDAMFRGDSDKAFHLLNEGLTSTVLSHPQQPRMSVYSDQIVWGRSPVRIDIAGGWTDTPPFCLLEGGNVVNFALELNGQPPIQAYIRPCKERRIVLRSIDLGVREEIETFDELADFKKVGSPFSISKAALVLAGFQPGFCAENFTSLQQQLEAFGCGIEVTSLSAIPAGSGLGTSSILAATILGVISDFCGLAWDKNEIARRTLVLEQMLTTGGGWQDQFGGILGGVKLLQTQKGFDQNPVVRWLPDYLYTQPEYASCHLLYYTGITRTAKKILAEIVRNMFLSKHEQVSHLRDMKQLALDMYEAIQCQNFQNMGHLLRQNWLQNQALDSGTNPKDIALLTQLIDDLCLGYKLPGAGGGGFLYMVAKDPEAAARIKKIILENQTNANARFVDMALSKNGLQISRS